MTPKNGANSGDMTLDFGAIIGAIQLASICINLHRFALKAGGVGQGRAGQETQQAPRLSELSIASERLVSFAREVPEVGLEPTRP